MEMEKIRELVQLVEDSEIQELELSNRGETIRISKSGGAQVLAPGMQMAPAPIPVPAPALAAPAAAAMAPAVAGVRGDNLKDISSPMVGTFYRSASPDAEAFVRVGDRVEKGDVVCIIEAMKVMNEIEAEVGGVVREIPVENAQPVEFGQPLFLIDVGG